MAKEVSNIMIDDEEVMRETPLIKTEETLVESRKTTKRNKTRDIIEEDGELVSCLRNERVTVRFVPKQTGLVSNPKHILYGGMAESAVRWFTLPKLSSGMYVNALTDREKEYLEDIMGLEYNALSIYKKVDNFWDNQTVRLTKGDNFLNLANPEDYIKYKILLSNKDFIAPSLQVLQDRPKVTYQFVIVQEGEETSNAKKEMSATMQSYMKFGEMQNDFDKLKVILETIEGKPYSKNTRIEFLQEKINKLIQADARLFLRIAEDKYLDTKVLIKRSVEEGLISNRGGMLYLKSDGTPLCDDNEEPTLNIAAKFLSAPKRQELKFSLEAKLKQ